MDIFGYLTIMLYIFVCIQKISHMMRKMWMKSGLHNAAFADKAQLNQ